MFFQEKIDIEKKETSIPNIFFEQILPIVSPVMLKIYMYAYYLSNNQELEEGDGINSNKKLAERLEISLDEVLHCWDFFESCGLIIKHRVNEEEADNFAVEFKNLKKIGITKKPINISNDELIAAYQNEEYRKMYDQIEQIIQIPLMHNDMKKINEFITQYNVPKDLVVEAVRFNLYRKKSKYIGFSLGILKNWYLDGVRTTEDLETMFKNKEKRYLEYKQILSNFGEYRLPTKPEEEMMDMWMDEYKFSIEAIQQALTRTTSIKSPNMNYLNGILKNWYEKLKEKKDEKLDATEQKKPIGNLKVFDLKEEKMDFNQKIFKIINFTRKTMTKKELDSLNFLYENYHSDDVELAARWLNEKEIKLTLENICKMLVDPAMEKDSEEDNKKITLDDIKDIDSKKRSKLSSKTATTKGNNKDSQDMDELEIRLQRRMAEKLAKKKNIQNGSSN